MHGYDLRGCEGIPRTTSKRSMSLRLHAGTHKCDVYLYLQDAVATQFLPYGLWNDGLKPGVGWLASYGASRLERFRIVPVDCRVIAPFT